MQLHLKSKKIWWVVQASLGVLPTGSNTPSSIGSGGRFCDQDDSQAMLAMIQSMNEEDQQEMDICESAGALWAALELKYRETLRSHARQYLKEPVR